jgi:hypothetical protein
MGENHLLLLGPEQFLWKRDSFQQIGILIDFGFTVNQVS